MQDPKKTTFSQNEDLYGKAEPIRITKHKKGKVTICWTKKTDKQEIEYIVESKTDNQKSCGRRQRPQGSKEETCIRPFPIHWHTRGQKWKERTTESRLLNKYCIKLYFFNQHQENQVANNEKEVVEESSHQSQQKETEDAIIASKKGTAPWPDNIATTSPRR